MKYLYFSLIPQQSQPQESTTTGKNLSTLDAVDLNSSVVEAIGSQAADVTINGQYRYGAMYSTKLARELDELADSAFTNLPLFGDGDDEVSRPGYYAIDEAVIEPLHPNSHDVWTYDLSLTLEGTQATHRQAVATSKDGGFTNDFGSDQTTHIAIPSGASVVDWWDGDAGTESPTPIETRSSAFGDLDVYDVDAASYSDPTLIYRSPGYESERDVHCRLWDDYGRGSKTDSDGIVQWVRAFATDHEPRGKLVVSNGLLRITLDDQAETIAAERWSSGSWTTADLGASGWAPVDVDVRTISPARVEVRILFSDGSTRYPLDMILARGATDALFARTPNATSATPSTLVDYLDPIASTTIYSAGAEQALVSREEVAE